MEPASVLQRNNVHADEGIVSPLRPAVFRDILWKHGLKSHLFFAPRDDHSGLRAVARTSERRFQELGLQQLQDYLYLPTLPRRVECFAVSHLGALETVAGMSVQVAGKTRQDHHRSFLMHSRKQWGMDDARALKKALRRRLYPLLRDLGQEERWWAEEGIVFDNAMEQERAFIHKTLADHAGEVESIAVVDEREFLVARRGQVIVGFGRIHCHPDGAREVASLFVSEEERGRHLGCFIVRKLLSRLTDGVAYAVADPKLREYYADVGFRTVRSVPRSIVEKERRLVELYPNEPRCIFLRFDTVRYRTDPSLTTQPDLLVFDGGRGRLEAVAEVIDSLPISIPMIGLGRRIGEVYLRDRMDPLMLPVDSFAASLLLRLRSEAHQCVRRHSVHGVSLRPLPALRSPLLQRFFWFGSFAG